MLGSACIGVAFIIQGSGFTSVPFLLPNDGFAEFGIAVSIYCTYKQQKLQKMHSNKYIGKSYECRIEIHNRYRNFSEHPELQLRVMQSRKP